MTDTKWTKDDPYCAERLAVHDAKIEAEAERRDTARSAVALIQTMLQREPESPHFKELSVAVGCLTVELKLAVADWNTAIKERQYQLDQFARMHASEIAKENGPRRNESAADYEKRKAQS